MLPFRRTLFSSIDNKASTAALLLTVVLVVALFPASTVMTTADAGRYFGTAVKIHEGEGNIRASGIPVIRRGPVFPLVLAGYFKLFGASMFSAMLALRTFWAASMILLFLLLRRVFRWQVALGGIILSLALVKTAGLSYYLLLDYPLSIFLPLLLLGGLAILRRTPTERDTRFLYLLLGITAGVGILFKELLIIYLPLPLLLGIIHRERLKTLIANTGVFAGGVVLTMIPWYIYVVSTTGKPAASTWFIYKHFHTYPGTSLASTAGSPPAGVLFLQSVDMLIVFSFFGLLAWGYFILHTLRTQQRHKLLYLAGFLLYIPLFLFLAKGGAYGLIKRNMGTFARQLAPFSLLTAGAVSAAIYALASTSLKHPLHSLFPQKPILRTRALSGVFLCAVLLLTALFATRLPPRLFPPQSAVQAWEHPGYVEVRGMLDPASERAHLARQLEKVVPEGSNMLVGSRPTKKGLFGFMANEDYRFHLPPGTFLTRNRPLPRGYSLHQQPPQQHPQQRRVLLLWKECCGPDITQVLYMTESAFLQKIQQKDMTHILLHKRRGLLPYLQKHSGFREQSLGATTSAKLFEVVNPTSMSVERWRKTYVSHAVKELAKDNETRELLANALQKRFGWSRQHVENVLQE